MEDFEDRCRSALGIVQRDLDSTGWVEFKMSPRNLSIRGPLQVCAAPPNGASRTDGDSRMTEHMPEGAQPYPAAVSAPDTLAEVLRISWPVCSDHGGQPMEPA